MEVDVDALLRSSRSEVGPRCGTCLWVRSRPVPERVKWGLAIENSRYNAAQIARAMKQVKSRLPTPGRLSVQRHRRDKHWETR